MTRPSEFARTLQNALGSYGWRGQGPPGPPPGGTSAFRTFTLSLDGGWVAKLRATWFDRETIELSPWQRGMRHVVMVHGEVTLPAAEQLAERLGVNGGLGISAAREFEVPGNKPEQRQFRGAQDYSSVVSDVLSYTTRVLEPWAREHANLDAWLSASEAIGREDPEVLAWDVPVMLAACGRGPEAMARLRAAGTIASVAADPGFAPFAERLEQVVIAGVDALPDAPEPLPLSATHARDRTAEDTIRLEFYEGWGREVAEQPVWWQLRFGARKLRSAIGAVRAASQGEGAGWWAPVAFAPDVEEHLIEVFESSGDPVDGRVGLQAELRGRSPQLDGGVEVVLRGLVVGIIRPEDIPTWGVVLRLEGARRARLTRKRDRPRFLLEVDIG